MSLNIYFYQIFKGCYLIMNKLFILTLFLALPLWLFSQEIEYYPISDTSGNIGLIDSTGKIILSPQLSMIHPVISWIGYVYDPNDSLDDMSDGGVITRDGRFVNLELESTIRDMGELLPIDLYFRIYNKDLKLYAVKTRKGYWGIINRDGEWVLNPDMQWIETVSDGYGIISKRDTGSSKSKYGIINPDGRIVIPPRFGSLKSFDGIEEHVYRIDYGGGGVSYDSYHEMIPHQAEYGLWIATPYIPYDPDNYHHKIKYGLIDRQGNWVADTQFSYDIKFTNGLLPAKYKGKYGVLKKDGTWLIAPQYEGIDTLSPAQEYFTFKQQGKWGIISADSKIIVEPTLDTVYHAYNFQQFFFAKKGGKIGTISLNGQWLIEPTITTIERYYDQFGGGEPLSCLLQACISEDVFSSCWGIITSSGTWLFEPQFNYNHACISGLTNGTRYIEIEQADGKTGIIDSLGRWVMKPIALKGRIELVADSFLVISQGVPDQIRYGTCDYQGKWLLQPTEGSIYRFSDYGLSFFDKNINKYGIIGLNGKFDLNPQFEEFPFYGGGINNCEINKFALAFKDKKYVMLAFRYGRWNMDYSMISEIEQIHCWGEPNNYIFMVHHKGKKGILSPQGKWFIAPEYHSISRFEYETMAGKDTLLMVIRADSILRQGQWEDATEYLNPRYGLFDPKGGWLFAPEWEKIAFENGKFYLTKGGKQWVADSKGNLIIESSFQFQQPHPKIPCINGRRKIYIKGKWGFSDCNDLVVITPRFLYLADFDGSLARYSQKSKEGYRWGYINRDGIIIYPEP